MRLSLRMRRIMRWMIALLLGMGLVVALVLTLALWSPGIARYLISVADEHLMELHLENPSGSLAGGLHADRLIWQDGDLTLTAESLRVDVDWVCLLRGTLCLDTLTAKRFIIRDTSPPEPDWQGFSLPAFSVPCPLVFRQLTLESLLIATGGPGEDSLGRFEGAGRLEGALLRVGRLSWQVTDSLTGNADLEATGDLYFQSPARANLSLSGQWHPPGVRLPWRTMRLSLNGALTRLEARLVTENGIEADAIADVTEPQLPLRLNAWTSGPVPELPWLAAPARLAAQGTLLGTLQTSASVGVKLEGYPALRLQADATATPAGLSHARIQVTEGTGSAIYTGRLSWRDGLTAEGELQARDLNLKPWHAALPIQLTGRTHLTVQEESPGWRIETKQLNIAGHYASTPFSLKGDADWQADHLESSGLTLNVAGQTLSLSGRLGTTLDASLSLDAPQLAALWPSLSGDLRAQLALSGTPDTPRFDLTAVSHELATPDFRLRDSQLSLAGTPEDHAWTLRTRRDITHLVAEGRGHLSGDTQKWHTDITTLSLTHADDTVRLEGPASLALSRSQAQLTQIALAHACLISGSNRVCLAGTADPPASQVHATLDVANLQLESLHAWQSLAGLPVQLIGRLTGQLNLNGSASQPAIQGELRWTDGQVVDSEGLARLTALEAHWRGHSGSGRLTLAATDWLNHRWHTTAPWEYQWADDALTLHPACIVSDATSLCLQGVASPETLDMTLTGTSELRSLLASHLPPDTRVSGPVHLHFRTQRQAGQPVTAEGRIQLDAPVVETDIPDAPPLMLRFDTIRLDTRADTEQIHANLTLSGRNLGRAQVQANIARKRPERPDVRFEIEQFALSTFTPVLSATRTLIEGELNAQGRWTGGWKAPQVTAELHLTDGRISGPQIPLPLEDLQLRGTLKGRQLELSGQAHSGEGVLHLNGEGQIGTDWQTQLKVSGERIPLSSPPLLTGTGTPDIHVQASAKAIRIEGTLKVDHADIWLEGGTSRIDPSPDIRVVREEYPQKVVGRNLPPVTLNLKLLVPDSVSARGYGADLKIGGSVDIAWTDHQSLTGQGLLQIREGRYEAYGQRLKIRSGQVQFNGPLRRPWLRIEAVREIDTTVVGLRIEGPPERLKATPFSEPSMPEDHVLYYLITGRPPGGQSTDERQMVNRAMLSLALTGSLPVAQTLADKLNISDFQVGTQGQGDQTTVQVSGYVSSRLYLEYGFGVFEPVNTLLTRYRLKENVYLEAVSGIEQILTLLWSKEF